MSSCLRSRKLWRKRKEKKKVDSPHPRLSHKNISVVISDFPLFSISFYPPFFFFFLVALTTLVVLDSVFLFTRLLYGLVPLGNSKVAQKKTCRAQAPQLHIQTPAHNRPSRQDVEAEVVVIWDALVELLIIDDNKHCLLLQLSRSLMHRLLRHKTLGFQSVVPHEVLSIDEKAKGKDNVAEAERVQMVSGGKAEEEELPWTEDELLMAG